MPLADAAVRNIKPQSKQFKRADGGGLYLLVKPNGTSLWRPDYRFYGLRKTLAISKYPDVPLADARAARENAKKLLARGIDPGVQKKQDRIAATIAQGNTFGVVADEYLAKMKAEKALSPRRDGFDRSGHPTLTPADRRYQNNRNPWDAEAPGGSRVHDTAHDPRGIIGRVFRFAIAAARAENDRTPGLRGTLIKHTPSNFAAITDPERRGQLMRAINCYGGGQH